MSAASDTKRQMLDSRLHDFGLDAIEKITDEQLSELAAQVLSERQSRGGGGPESRLDSMIAQTKYDHRRLDREVHERAEHDAEELRRVAETGVNRGGVMGHTQDGSRLDELVTKRGEVWERYRELVYVRDGDFPEEVPSDE